MTRTMRMKRNSRSRSKIIRCMSTTMVMDMGTEVNKMIMDMYTDTVMNKMVPVQTKTQTTFTMMRKKKKTLLITCNQKRL